MATGVGRWLTLPPAMIPDGTDGATPVVVFARPFGDPVASWRPFAREADWAPWWESVVAFRAPWRSPSNPYPSPLEWDAIARFTVPTPREALALIREFVA